VLVWAVLQVSRDPAGREVMVSLVGTTVREATGAVTAAVAERFDAAWFVTVLVMGMLAAVALQTMLRMLGGLVLGA
jgi:hypothetical protein